MTSEQIHHAMQRFDELLQQYTLVVSGWAGLIIALCRFFSLVDEGVAFIALVFVSAMAGLYGHHGLAMGWFKAIDTNHSD
jgi:hypothetical protein